MPYTSAPSVKSAPAVTITPPPDGDRLQSRIPASRNTSATIVPATIPLFVITTPFNVCGSDMQGPTRGARRRHPECDQDHVAHRGRAAHSPATVPLLLQQ